jgi:Sulfotransferase domain
VSEAELSRGDSRTNERRRHPWLGPILRISPRERLPVAMRRAIRPITARVRSIGIGPTDVLVASYPRSGSTWLRFLLTEVLTGEPAEWDAVNRTIPDVGRHLDAPATLASGGRLVKTHDRYAGRVRRVVYLVRDVRAVTLSEYRWILRGGERRTLDQHIEDTLEGRTPMSLFGLWSDHVAYWLESDHARRGDLLLIRFEDLRKDPEQMLREVVHFLGANPSDEDIAAAIENNTVRRMQAKEERAERADVAPGDERFRWVGQGSVTGWRARLSDRQIARIESRTTAGLARLGYPVGARRG